MRWKSNPSRYGNYFSKEFEKKRYFFDAVDTLAGRWHSTPSFFIVSKFFKMFRDILRKTCIPEKKNINLICCLHYFQFMPHWIKKHSEIEIILKMYLYHQMHKESRKIFQHHILYFLKVQTKYFHIFTYTNACKKWNKQHTKLKLLLFVCSYIF